MRTGRHAKQRLLGSVRQAHRKTERAKRYRLAAEEEGEQLELPGLERSAATAAAAAILSPYLSAFMPLERT